MQIIYAINSRILREARKPGMSGEQIAAISLIDEGGERRVRMANLALSARTASMASPLCIPN
jgi:starch phosphorylase